MMHAMLVVRRSLRAAILGFSVFVLSLVFIIPSAAWAAEATLFGPNTYIRTSGSPDVFVDEFSAVPGEARLIVKNGNQIGEKRVEDSVSSARVIVNGEEVFEPSDFNKNVYYLEESITLTGQNSISIELASNPESFITVEVVQTNLNNPPVADPQTVTTDEDTSTPIILTGADSDGDPLTYHLISVPGHGSLSGTAPSYTYSPVADFNGMDSIVFRVNDGILDSYPATVDIQVNPVNDAPAANDDEATTDENIAVTINVIDNDTDVDGDTLSLAGFTQATNGTVVDNTDGTFTYTPGLGFHGADSFTYTVGDGNGGIGIAVVYITIIETIPLPTVDITADPADIMAGESTTLSWSSANADGVSIDNGLGTVDINGSADVSPSVTTTYTITATGPGGAVEDSVTVVVNQPLPTVIISADPDTIITGSTSNLTWTSAHAETVVIDNGIGIVEPNSSISVSPLMTTIYTITATGPGGTATDSAVVTVNPSGPTVSLSADPANIVAGDNTTLTWASANANTVSIDNGIGPVDLNGSLEVTPSITTTFTVTAAGTEGTALDSVTVTVHQVPCVTITAEPSSIYLGSSSVLSWTSTYADSAMIDNGIGAVQTNGSIVVAPDKTTTYTIVARGYGGDISAHATVTVTACTITGLVTDTSTSQTLSDVMITITDSLNTHAIQTDVSGHYSVSGIIHGEFSVNFEKNGYLPHIETGTLSPGEIYMLDIQLDPQPELSITITSPVDGAFVCASPVIVTGSVNNNAHVTVNGIEATVEDSIFTASVPVNEGVNIINAVAADPYGNSSTHNISVTRDSTLSTLTGTVINGYTGEPVSDATVTVIDSMKEQSTQAGGDGVYAITCIQPGIISIQWFKPGYLTNEYSCEIYTAETLHIDLPMIPDMSGDPPITIVSPVTGENIMRPDIMVRGKINPPLTGDMNISVNGIPALVYGNDYVANHIKLEEGSNVITVSAVDEQGNAAEASVTVNAVTTGPYITLTTYDVSGVSPLTTTATIDIPFNYVNSALSSMGYGQVEFLNSSIENEYTIRLTGQGIYYFTAEATEDTTNEIYTDTVGVIVYDQAELDAMLREKWNSMKSMLISGDIDGALEYFAIPSRNEYQEIFTIINDELSAMASGMEDIEPVYMKEKVAKYRIKKNEDISGVSYRITYYIYFVRDAYGHWYIQSF